MPSKGKPNLNATVKLNPAIGKPNEQRKQSKPRNEFPQVPSHRCFGTFCFIAAGRHSRGVPFFGRGACHGFTSRRHIIYCRKLLSYSVVWPNRTLRSSPNITPGFCK